MTDGEIRDTMDTFGITREEATTVEYLGDGIYATFDGYNVWLRTLEGHRVALEPPLVGRVVEYQARQVREAAGGERVGG